MKINEFNNEFLVLCGECGDLVSTGYEIQLSESKLSIILCDDCTVELSKYLLQETYLNDI